MTSQNPQTYKEIKDNLILRWDTRTHSIEVLVYDESEDEYQRVVSLKCDGKVRRLERLLWEMEFLEKEEVFPPGDESRQRFLREEREEKLDEQRLIQQMRTRTGTSVDYIPGSDNYEYFS